jgi:predicted nucleic-acid-binding protein
MLAIDTNLIVRYLTKDHKAESERAKAAIDTEKTFVCKTVFLESEWVLRSVYGYGSGQLCRTLRAFAGLPNVTVEDPVLVSLALDWMERGMDFADALHLASAKDCEAFISFDKGLARTAKKVGTTSVREP